jgi:hypothetical protein
MFPLFKIPMSVWTTTAPVSATAPTRMATSTKLYEFDSQYAYDDQEIWRILGNTLNKLRARGLRELSVRDLGCGPGTGFGALSTGPEK